MRDFLLALSFTVLGCCITAGVIWLIPVSPTTINNTKSFSLYKADLSGKSPMVPVREVDGFTPSPVHFGTGQCCRWPCYSQPSPVCSCSWMCYPREVVV